ncbi:Sir2 family NAD-dependent protein deacetylase [Hahella aquimaris]|uniref:SIR2 family NAD-dependent protein deacylase n=1 Tax=Hahella sp. HNIBRBA332 TaxID=3015983 RepID=UPI00273B0FF0|nr:Sir2 family NAD-dependent protein deacetylase [Hahella sp. HNIBRBA332]WLQ13199.1 Sir2 family NAD-dependent protein deacetylase [Hahella sp. HNIBRBA332]
MKHIVVITGAGISAESGIQTYRGENGLWRDTDYNEVASLTGWRKDREKVLTYWNAQRRIMAAAQPNAAHYALSRLEECYLVSIITQNVDNLHERAGSSQVLHIHGELMKSRSSVNPKLVYQHGDRDINIGDKCERGSQLRPDVVWFGEPVPLFSQAQKIVHSADIMLVVGTSLEVYPAAYLVEKRMRGVTMYIVDPNADPEAHDAIVINEPATQGVVPLVEQLLEQA